MKFEGKEITFYQGIKDMPAENNQLLEKAMLLASGVGSDLESISRHFTYLYEYIKGDDKEKAMKEAINLHNNMYMILERKDLYSMLIVPFIKEVGGKRVEAAWLEQNSEDIVKKLSGKYKQQEIRQIAYDLKKKLATNFNPVFLAYMGEMQTSPEN